MMLALCGLFKRILYERLFNILSGEIKGFGWSFYCLLDFCNFYCSLGFLKLHKIKEKFLFHAEIHVEHL